MGGTQQQLKDRLGGVIQAFNSNNVNNVMPFLDDSAANVFSIKHHDPHPGKHSSEQFLAKAFNDQPHFVLVQPSYTVTPSGDNITNATITGFANWTDLNGADLLSFAFDCVYKEEEGNKDWYFTHVEASAVVASKVITDKLEKPLRENK